MLCGMAGQESPRPAIAPSKWPKYAALVFVVLHQTAAVFTMRHSQASRKASGRPPYLSTVTVFTTEVAKLVGSFIIVAIEEGGPIAAVHTVVDSFQGSLTELLRLTVPALLYSVQNNLLFVALAHLTAAVYTVSYQLKTLTTALFSVLVLRRALSGVQWVSLAVLSSGVALLQLPSHGSGGSSATVEASEASISLLGMGSVCGAAITSGFCGVYMEKLLKQTKGSLWLRNVQLALVGAPVSFACALWADYSRIQDGGFLQGYDGLVWGIVCINALGGLAIAAVLRYADNIVKCFATAIAVLVSCVLSNFMGELVLSSIFMIGAGLVASSTVMYGLGSDARLQDFLTTLSPISVGAGKRNIIAVVISVGALCVVMVTLVANQLEADLPFQSLRDLYKKGWQATAPQLPGV